MSIPISILSHFSEVSPRPLFMMVCVSQFILIGICILMLISSVIKFAPFLMQLLHFLMYLLICFAFADAEALPRPFIVRLAPPNPCCLAAAITGNIIRYFAAGALGNAPFLF